MSIDYYGVVSICDTHGIHLPVDCIEMVVEIVRHADLASNKAAVAQSTQTDASMGDLPGLSEGYRRGIKDAFHRINMMNVNRDARTGDETCTWIVREFAEWVNVNNSDDATAAAPAQPSRAEWINVKDRLPDTDRQLVVVFDPEHPELKVWPASMGCRESSLSRRPLSVCRVVRKRRGDALDAVAGQAMTADDIKALVERLRTRASNA